VSCFCEFVCVCGSWYLFSIAFFDSHIPTWAEAENVDGALRVQPSWEELFGEVGEIRVDLEAMFVDQDEDDITADDNEGDEEAKYMGDPTPVVTRTKQQE
jgi:hypothetical protein